jgi:hypothetical protein
MNEHVKQRMSEFAMNIDDFEIGQEIVDASGSIYIVSNKTMNSIEVMKKIKSGINYKNWFEMGRFNRTFKKIK